MDLERALHLNNTFITENQQFILGRLKEAVGSSSTLLTEMGLYIHYTIMWLFVRCVSFPRCPARECPVRVRDMGPATGNAYSRLPRCWSV